MAEQNPARSAKSGSRRPAFILSGAVIIAAAVAAILFILLTGNGSQLDQSISNAGLTIRYPSDWVTQTDETSILISSDRALFELDFGLDDIAAGDNLPDEFRFVAANIVAGAASGDLIDVFATSATGDPENVRFAGFDGIALDMQQGPLHIAVTVLDLGNEKAGIFLGTADDLDGFRPLYHDMIDTISYSG